jgi:hypothetical protein
MNSGGFCESISSFFPEKGKGSRLLGYVVAGSKGKKEEGRKGKVDSKFFFPVSRSRFRSTCALLFFFFQMFNYMSPPVGRVDEEEMDWPALSSLFCEEAHC